MKFKRIVNIKSALWALGAVLIITGLVAGNNYVTELTEQVNEANTARESAEKERDDAKADADAAKRREAEEKAKNEQLRKDLQAKRERQAEEARLAAAKPPSTSPVTGNSTIAGVSESIPTVSNAVGCSIYEPLVRQYDWNVPTMMRIMNLESGCNPNNHNYGDNHGVCLGSYGLFQIGCVHGIAGSLLADPATNISTAYNIWRQQGYTAWSTY